MNSDIRHQTSDIRLKSEVCSLKSARGQALIELAILGAFIVFLMGALINYGLNSEYRQHAAMEAFREALGLASERLDPDDASIRRGSATAIVVRDRHIASPANPFAIGSVVPVVASDSVIRDPHLDFTADSDDVLPRIALAIDGVSIDCPSPGAGCTTAGFRTETNVPAGSLERYNEIYGADNITDEGDGECLREGPPNPTTGEKTCQEFAKQLKIIDTCEGEVLTFEGCRQQAKRIRDSEFCRTECERGRRLSGGADSCGTICQQRMNVPWYAEQNALEGLFARAGVRNMGLQPDTANRTELETILVKAETGKFIATTSRITWQETVGRQLVYRMKLPPGTVVHDVPVNRDGVARRPLMATPKDERTERTWETAW